MAYTSRIQLTELDYNFIKNTIKQYYQKGVDNKFTDDAGETDIENLTKQIETDLKWRFLNNDNVKTFEVVFIE